MISNLRWLGPLAAIVLTMAACGGKGEGAEPGDCTDGADNDEDGLFDCDDDGCALPPDFDPVPHLVNAHRIASGVADERIDVEDDGLYFHNLRFEPPAPVDTDAFVPGEAHWVVTFVTYGDDLWGHTNLFVELDIQAGTVEMYEDFAHDSLAKVRVEELEELAVSADAVVDALDRSWSWWGDVGFGALNRAVYEDTLQWTVVSEDGDDRWSYDAVTGVRTDR